jgi:hypothetical protein
VAQVIASWLAWPRRERLSVAILAAILLGSLTFYMHSRYGFGDVRLYHRYAQAFWLGSPPLHSLPAEYPVLSLLPFTLTLLPPIPDYVTVYGLWMLVLLGAGYLAVRHLESARAAQVMAVYLVLGCFATVLGRFDLVPAATTVVAYWAARERRFTLAYAVLAAGTLIKLYPLLLVPVVALEQYRVLGPGRLWAPPPRALMRGVALFGVTVAIGFGLSALLNPGGWLSPFTFNSVRPLQVESVPASLLWLSGLAGLPVAPDHSFHSYNVTGLLGRDLSLLAGLGLAGGCLAVYWLHLRGRLSLVRAITLCMLVVVCTGRVFSPQYLIWVLPLVAIAEAEYDLIWLAICLLTTLIFPYAYDWAGLHGLGLRDYPLFFSALIAVRNGLLLLVTVRFAQRSLRAAAAPAQPAAQRSSSVA